VIEPDRNPTWSEKHGDTIADHESARVIHFESTSAVQFHSEHAKRLKLPQSVENLFKAFSRHCRIPVFRRCDPCTGARVGGESVVSDVQEKAAPIA
jgi:hypothetical protein